MYTDLSGMRETEINEGGIGADYKLSEIAVMRLTQLTARQSFATHSQGCSTHYAEPEASESAGHSVREIADDPGVVRNTFTVILSRRKVQVPSLVRGRYPSWILAGTLWRDGCRGFGNLGGTAPGVGRSCRTIDSAGVA